MEDAAGFFAKVFGGDRFEDYIGQISLMKDMTNVMTDEEKAEMQQEMKASYADSPVPPSTPLERHSPHSPQPFSPASYDSSQYIGT